MFWRIKTKLRNRFNRDNGDEVLNIEKTTFPCFVILFDAPTAFKYPVYAFPPCYDSLPEFIEVNIEFNNLID